MTVQTFEEANAALRQAVGQRINAAAAGKPAEEWYATPSAADVVERFARDDGENLKVDDARAFRGDSLLADRGTTAKFGTGAVRSDTFEDFRYDLVSPIGLREVARACAEGAEKYGDWNWEKGMPVHDLLNHAIAHIYGFLSGDRSEPHLGHAAWNLLAAIHSQELWPHLNNDSLRGQNCSPPSEQL